MHVLRLPEPGLVLMVGPAGAGKSTLARRLFAPDEILSSDALRAMVAGDEADQSVSRAAFAILHRELARRMADGRTTVVDATNLRGDHRRPLLARARAAGLPTTAIVLDLPEATVRERNAGRARVVDDAVVARHLAWLRATVDERRLGAEGIDPIVVLTTAAEVDGLVLVRASTVDRRTV